MDKALFTNREHISSRIPPSHLYLYIQIYKVTSTPIVLLEGLQTPLSFCLKLASVLLFE